MTQTKSAFLYCDGTDVVASETDEGAGIATPVSIANGGTGQTTAGAALGAGIATPVSIANGGTGQTTAGAALTALGGTATGVSVFTAASAAAARSAIGAVALGDANVFTEPQSITKNDAVTNTVTDLLILTHSTSGTAAASFGAGLVYKLEDAAGNIETVASIDAVLTDATNGSEDVKLSMKTMIAGAAKAEVAFLGAGWVVGAATGGDKGIGTLNLAGTLYFNNVAWTVSPAFTSTPTAPTASPGTNTTQIATTAFVAAAIPPINIQTFTSSGTWTRPSSGTIVLIRCWGAGWFWWQGQINRPAAAVAAVDITKNGLPVHRLPRPKQ